MLPFFFLLFVHVVDLLLLYNIDVVRLRKRIVYLERVNTESSDNNNGIEFHIIFLRQSKVRIKAVIRNITVASIY